MLGQEVLTEVDKLMSTLETESNVVDSSLRKCDRETPLAESVVRSPRQPSSPVGCDNGNVVPILSNSFPTVDGESNEYGVFDNKLSGAAGNYNARPILSFSAGDRLCASGVFKEELSGAAAGNDNSRTNFSYSSLAGDELYEFGVSEEKSWVSVDRNDSAKPILSFNSQIGECELYDSGVFGEKLSVGVAENDNPVPILRNPSPREDEELNEYGLFSGKSSGAVTGKDNAKPNSSYSCRTGEEELYVSGLFDEKSSVAAAGNENADPIMSWSCLTGEEELSETRVFDEKLSGVVPANDSAKLILCNFLDLSKEENSVGQSMPETDKKSGNLSPIEYGNSSDEMASKEFKSSPDKLNLVDVHDVEADKSKWIHDVEVDRSKWKRSSSDFIDSLDERCLKKAKSLLGGSDSRMLEETSMISTESCKIEEDTLIKKERSKGHNMALITKDVEEIVPCMECSEEKCSRTPSGLSPTKPGTEINGEKATQHRIGKMITQSYEEGSYGAQSPIELDEELLSTPYHEDIDKGHERLTDCGHRISNRHISINSTEILVENYLEQPPETAVSFPEDQNDKIDCTLAELPESAPTHKRELDSSIPKTKKKSGMVCSFVGDPIPVDEARERWQWRYDLKGLHGQRCKGQSAPQESDDEDRTVTNVEYHYAQAKVYRCILNLGDCVYVKGEGKQKHVGRIIEFFKTTDGEDYFRVQWFYRAEDTVMKEQADFHEKKRLFYSTIMNDNLLDCIISKVRVKQIIPRVNRKSISLPSSDFYFDMEYCVEYSTFQTLTDGSVMSLDSSSPNCIETEPKRNATTPSENVTCSETDKRDLLLLDLYAGCGGMSTGLCLGANISGVNLITRWALDSDRSACESLKLNHPETQVRNESAEDFLELLKEWERLSRHYGVNYVERTHQQRSVTSKEDKSNTNSLDADNMSDEEFEVSSLVDICYGDPNQTGKCGVHFLVRWSGYSKSDDTWEPIDGLSNCREKIREFVIHGLKSKILPLPGDVGVICGGPPCQGISGYNRYRNVDSPLDDERNRQIIVFMDIVQFLRPKFVLMENVVDILRFDKGSLGRYALSRLVHMKYQARLGTIAAGCYGLPQFRLRVFLWGAHPNEKLPKFPLPTHDVIVRYWPPLEFERNTVAYDEDQTRNLEKALVLQDAISDLPDVTNHESREEMPYGKPPETEFQEFIRSTKYAMTASGFCGMGKTGILLYDHRPYPVNEDDYLRICEIPKRKGANFRDLPGVVVGADNVARRDPGAEKMLPSGKSMLQDYLFTFEQGKSKRPFARLWWDETVPTVVTFPSHHSQAALHPEQDRVLTLREYARLQGFPDYYRFCGTLKERYCQVGNAVAVPVSRALGYALGLSVQGVGGNEPLMTLPPKFAHSTTIQLRDHN